MIGENTSRPESGPHANNNLAWVLHYISRGFSPVALHYPTATGATPQCSCSDAACGRAIGKHPLFAKWQEQPEMTAEEATKFWTTMNPKANVGLRMGRKKRLVALDFDGEKSRESLAKLEEELGPLPPTRTTKSGRPDGGEHRIFRVPDALDLDAILNSGNGRPGLAPGIDVRAEGGQVVAPPSLHYSGNHYAVGNDLEPAELPQAWYDALPKHGDSDAAAGETFGAYERKMAFLGDSPPGPAGLLGFHNVLLGATAAWIGAGRGELGALKSDIKRRVDEAPQKPGRNVAEYKADAYLDRIIAGAVAKYGKEADAAKESAITEGWGPLRPDLFDKPPPTRPWLLRHPSEVVPAPCPGAGTVIAGDGLFPLGKAGLLVSDGGVGKTKAEVALAISIVTGRPWFGHYEVAAEARGRKVLLALGEDDTEDAERLLYNARVAYGLSDEEQRVVLTRIVVRPLAGKLVALLEIGPDRHTRIASRALAAFREKLAADGGETGWGLIVIDTLARFADEEAETDNAAATRFAQAVESLIAAAPGKPSVLVAHHASLDGVKTGEIRSRGATGIRNAFRWEGTLRADGDDVLFKQTKSNYSRPMPEPQRLVRVSGAEGFLRAASDTEDAKRTKAVEKNADEVAIKKETDKARRKDAAQAATIARCQEMILAGLRGATERVTSQAKLVAFGCGSNTTVRYPALGLLESAGRIKKMPAQTRKAGYPMDQSAYFVIVDPPAATTNGAAAMPQEEK